MANHCPSLCFLRKDATDLMRIVFLYRAVISEADSFRYLVASYGPRVLEVAVCLANCSLRTSDIKVSMTVSVTVGFAVLILSCKQYYSDTQNGERGDLSRVNFCLSPNAFWDRLQLPPWRCPATIKLFAVFFAFTVRFLLWSGSWWNSAQTASLQGKPWNMTGVSLSELNGEL